MSETISTNSMLNIKTVMLRTGLSRSTIYRLRREGKFPKPVITGANILLWEQLELDAWKKSLKRKTY